MSKIRLGVIYPMPKEYGVSIRINRLVSKLPSNFELQEIIQEKWHDSFFGKIAYLIKQLILINDKKFKPDIIFGVAPIVTGSIPALYAKFIKKSPLIIDWDDSFQDFSKKIPMPWNISYWEYRAVVGSDRVIVVSKNLFKIATKIRNTSKNLLYLPNGVDIELFDPKKYNSLKIKASMGLKKEDFIIFYVGHIGKLGNKFVGKQIVDAASILVPKYSNIKFVIGGYGKGLNILKNYVAKNNLKDYFIFLGYVNEVNVPKYISIADICIDSLGPSTALNMGNRSSMKLKEYMAMAKACISSNVGENIIDLDGGECGILIENQIQLINSLEKLFKDRRLRKKFGDASRKRIVKTYNLGKQQNIFYDFVKRQLYE